LPLRRGTAIAGIVVIQSQDTQAAHVAIRRIHKSRGVCDLREVAGVHGAG
jgi:hypothetical protein